MTEPPGGPIGPGSVLGQYRVLRSIGRGGAGEVFLARDMALGRRVALKVLSADRLGAPEAVERFLAEARTTARFSHPHIVTVYGTGMHWGSPFLVLEYLEGETLRQRVEQGPLGLREALRLGRAVADALSELHRHGILHRDLKPENVIIPADGRPRVLDFGLARPLAVPADLEGPPDEDEEDDDDGLDLAGTPPYMAPELWLGRPAGPAADLWALGVLLHELLDGRRPYGDLARRELIQAHMEAAPVPALRRRVPEEIAALVATCLDKRPEARPAAGRVVEVLDDLLEGRGRRGDASPFRGLLPWEEGDSHRFFGREAEVAEAVEQLRREPALSVVGPSGAGKSSFVHAGVIPRLRERGNLTVIDLRPGRRPLWALAVALVGAGGGRGGGDEPSAVAEALAAELAEAPARLGLHLTAIARQRVSGVLLVVDQLEECVTLCQDRAERGAFLAAVCAATDDPGGPVRLVLTLRDDFLGLLAEGDLVRRMLGRLTVLRTPGPAALEEILTRPVLAAGYGWDDPALVARMVAEVEGAPAALALLQVAGRLLWERRDPGKLLLLRSAYEAMGGMGGALALHADGVLAGLSPSELVLTRQILLRLVAPDRLGRPGHRRVVTRAALLQALGEGAAPVLDRLVAGRLVLVRQARDPGAAPALGDAELELVHESLIPAWSRLSRWIEESHERLSLLAEVEQAAELWDRRGRRAEELWRGDALQEALARLGRLDSVPPVVRRFLVAGRARQWRWQQRKRVSVGVGFLLVLAVAIFLALQTREAVLAGRDALQQRRVAERRQAEVQRESAEAAWRAGDLVEARARLRDALEIQDSGPARALWWRLDHALLRWRLRAPARVLAVAVAPDGCNLAAGLSDRGVLVVDQSGGVLRHLELHIDKVSALAFTPDGGALLSGSLDGALLSWDPLDWRGRSFGEQGAAVRALAFAPDGGRLVVGDELGRVSLWDVATGEVERTWQAHDSSLTDLALSPDGGRLATVAQDGRLDLWSLPTGQLLGSVEGHESGEFEGGVAFHPGGDLLADGGVGHVVRLLDARSLAPVATLEGHAGPITAVRWSPDGRRLASASQDQTLRLWDMDGSGRHEVLRGHGNWINDIAFSDDGALLVSGGRDEELRVWNLAAFNQGAPVQGHSADVLALAFGRAGRLLVTGDRAGGLRTWDAASGRQTGSLVSPTAEVLTIAASAGGGSLAVAGADGAIWLLEASSGRVVRLLRAGDATVLALRFGPGDASLQALDARGGLRTWDLASGQADLVRRGDSPVGQQGRFAAQEHLAVAAGSDGIVRVWETGSGRPVASLAGHQGRAIDADVSPDGRLVAAVGIDRRLLLWPVRGGPPRVLARFDRDPWSVAFTADGRGLGVSCADGSIWLLDLDGRRDLLGRHRVGVNAVRFVPGGRLAVSAAEDGTVQVWDLTRRRPLRWASLLAPREGALLGEAGWTSLLEEPAALPALPAGLVPRDVRLAARTADGAALCLQTWGGRLQRWDLTRGSLLAEADVPRLAGVLALPGGCALRDTDGTASWFSPDGAVREVRRDASAVGAGDGELLLAAGGAVRAYREEDLRPTWIVPLAEDVTAVAQGSGCLVVGLQDGRLLAFPPPPDPSPPLTLEDSPSSPATALLPVGGDLLLAGFGDGTVGLWSLRDGVLLVDEPLYGPVVHLGSHGARLLAATELGDQLVWDLSVLAEPYCDLMRAVWAEVPVVWRQQGLRQEGPPQGHVCAKP